MSTELATRNLINNLDDLRQVSQVLVASGYFTMKNGNQEARLAEMATKVMAGQEMGFKPFASAKGIHIIQGSPTIGGNLMASAVKNSAKYDYRVREITNEVCKVEFYEYIDGKRESLGVSEFTAADAKAAGTQNMPKYPRNMLFNRAISNGVRWYCPDVFEGVTVYTPEEMGASVDSNGDVIEGSWTVAPVSPKKSNEEAQNQLAALMEEYPVDAIMAANGGAMPTTVEMIDDDVHATSRRNRCP
jgi:hypothetical protein